MEPSPGPGGERRAGSPYAEPPARAAEADLAGTRAGEGALWRRLLWFVALYAGGIAALAAVVYFLRAVVPH